MRSLLLVPVVLSGLCATIITALFVAAFFDPTQNRYALHSTILWTTWAPHIFLAAMAALCISMMALRRRWPRIRGLLLALSLAATMGSGFILGDIVIAVQEAGGAANPFTGLILGAMTEPEPDRLETIAHVDGQELKAALFLPGNSGTPRPILVYIHGGGFMAGTRTETAADLRWFADHGFVVVSIDYRLFSPGNPTWDKAPADAACGLAWTAANAQRLGGDAGRIALLGDSAGGNLAVNLGFATADGKITSPCGPVPVPRAIAVQYPAVDPISLYQRGYPVHGFEPAMLVEGYIGGSPEAFPERIAAIASVNFITPAAPPTLIIEPEKDSLVVSDGVYAFAGKAKAGGVDIELVRIPFANHIYNQIAANSIGNQAGRSIRLRFLNERLR